MDEILADFNSNGLNPGELQLDGKVHRFEVDQADTKKSGWYVGHSNHTRKSGEVFNVVIYGNYKTGDKFKYVSDGVKMTAEDKKALKDQIEKSRKIAEETRAIFQEQVSHDVLKKWDSLPKEGVSEYLTRKQISECQDLGIRFSPKDKSFYVPLIDVSGKLWSVQKIQNDGGKFFFPGGRVEDCFHVIGKIESSDTVRIAEGFATAASISMGCACPVVVAFNSGNLGGVADCLRKKYPSKVFVICGDDDRWSTKMVDGVETPFNGGRVSAEETAKRCLGKAIFPKFRVLVEKKTTDFNDLHCSEGLDEVKNQIISVNVERLFVLALGFKEKEYFYTSSANRQIVTISKFAEVDFLNLMPINYWESVFPGQGAQRVNWVEARSQMMEQARLKGIFQSRHVRGAGVWNDEGRIVVNMGDHLIVDGLRMELSDINSRFFYTLGVSLSSLHSSPLSADECNPFIEACSTFKWLKKDYGFVLAGSLVVSRICGALPVRPHLWVTGSSQTGKSTLMEGLIKPIIGEPVLHAVIGTSEAGIRQGLKADAIPVMFDEFETSNQNSDKISEIVELLRAAWSESEAQIIKGSSSGNASYFQVRFCGIVSSIRVNLKNDADKSRFAIIELAPHDNDQEHWLKLSSLLSQIDKEYGDRLFARTIKMVPVLLANYKKLKKSLAKRSSQRFGDQYGMILAGYSILLSDEELSDEEVEFLANSVELSDEKIEAKVKDHDDCLNQLLTTSVQLDIMGERRTYSIGQAIIDALTDNRVEGSLQLYGIRVKSDSVAISSSNAELENKVFGRTRWSKAWANSLCRIQDAQKNKVVWISGRSAKCTVIPISNFRDLT